MTIALLAVAFAAGALLGWMLRGERRERADAVRLSRMQSQLDSQQAGIERLQRQRDALQEKIDDARHQQHQADRRVVAMREALDEQMALRRRLDGRLGEAQARIATEYEERKKLSRQLRLLIQRTRESRDERDAATPAPVPAAASEPAPEPAPEPAATPPPEPTAGQARHDLRSVRGIGPAMKRELAAHGIRTLEELAALDDRRIDKLDRELRFPGRIRRERWVEQARELVDDGHA